MGFWCSIAVEKEESEVDRAESTNTNDVKSVVSLRNHTKRLVKTIQNV
jgi:hypothetical protein